MTKQLIKAQKAYSDADFLKSTDARPLRMLSEFLQPLGRFRREGVKDTIVFFGSARIKSGKMARETLKQTKRKIRQSQRITGKLRSQLKDAESDFEMSKYYEDATKLSKMLTGWSKKLYRLNHFVVCSGGGPGIMEAANKGARLARGRSIGLNISLPHEQFPNPYVSPELNFEFHYFFMRKFWFAYLAKAFVMFPGGFGTFDELMEILTLLQTDKIKKKVTVVLYGKEYWNSVLNFPKLMRLHLISPGDMKLFTFADTPQDAFRHLVKELQKNYPAETEEQ